MQACFIAKVLKKTRKGTLAPPFTSDEDSPAWLNQPSATAHRVLTDFRKAAQHTGAVLGVEPRITPQPAHVLCGMYASCAVRAFFSNEEFFLFQIVESRPTLWAETMSCALFGLVSAIVEPINDLANDIHMQSQPSTSSRMSRPAEPQEPCGFEAGAWNKQDRACGLEQCKRHVSRSRSR